MTRKTRIVTLTIAAVFAVTGLIARAGDLEPPLGPVGPTMKTLTQIEPRTPILASDLPLTVNQPGSYYFVGNIPTAGGGITIAADHVSIDLMGFSLTGGTGHGISSSGTRTGIVVKNGIVSGWDNGGVFLNSASDSVVSNVLVQGNTGIGIWVGPSGTIADCTARSNGSIGFNVFPGGTIRGCTAEENGSEGIQAGQGCSVTACVSKDNGTFGFEGSSATVFQGCSAYSNDGDGFNGLTITVIGCTAQANGGDGILSIGGTIINCTASSNTGDGIQVSSFALVAGNNCNFNGAAGDGAGIHVSGADNRIEDNTVAANDRGIDVDSSGNVIVRNTCSGNTTNWSVVAGNVILVVNATTAGAVNGNSGGTAPGSTDPNANFTY